MDMRSQFIREKELLEKDPNRKCLLAEKSKLTKELAYFSANRDKVTSSAVYRFDTCLKKVGCDRNAYHKQSIDGNKGRILMERRKEFGSILFDEMKLCLRETKLNRENMLEGKEDILGLATENELKDEVEFMVQTLHLLNAIHPAIRLVRPTLLSAKEIEDIEKNIARIKAHWNCKRSWEEKKISITPKWHLLFHHMTPSLKRFGRICHMAEDPIERTHKEDKNLDRTFYNQRNRIARENSKSQVVLMKGHRGISRKIQEEQENRKRKFKNTSIQKKKVKVENLSIVKMEQRNGENIFTLSM